MNNTSDLNYVYEMRKAFSHKHMITPNGELNHKYFLQKIGKYWSEDETNLLYKGIEKYGVGQVEEIKEKFLPNWSTTYIDLYTKLLFKTVDIAKYKGKKYTKKEIDEIVSLQ